MQVPRVPGGSVRVCVPPRARARARGSRNRLRANELLEAGRGLHMKGGLYRGRVLECQCIQLNVQRTPRSVEFTGART